MVTLCNIRKHQIGRMVNAPGSKNIPVRPKLVEMLAKRWNQHKIRVEGAHPRFGGFANDLLERMLAKYEFMEKYMPEYSYIGINQNMMMIKDAKLNMIVDVQLKNGKLYCNYDKSQNCGHVMFAIAIPEIVKLDTTEIVLLGSSSNATAEESKKKLIEIELKS